MWLALILFLFTSVAKSDLKSTFLKMWKLTNSMEQYLYWQYNSRSPTFMEPEDSLPCSQKSDTCPYPDPDEYIKPFTSDFRSILIILSSHLRMRLPGGLLPSGFPTKHQCTFLTTPRVLHALSSRYLKAAFSTSKYTLLWRLVLLPTTVACTTHLP
jgi:hypothetical protein